MIQLTEGDSYMKTLLNDMYKIQYSNEVRNGQNKYAVCQCFSKCKTCDFDYDSSFICNKSLKLGEWYERAKIKVLFIGKEDVSRNTEDILRPASFSDVKNQHYIGTKHILAALLGYCSADDITNYRNKEIHFKEEEHLHKQFALTNHYHCAFKNKSQEGKNHGIRVSDSMWKNCASIVRNEIEILQPDVVVIQAGWSAKRKMPSKTRVKDVEFYFDKEKWTVTENDDIFGLYEAYNKETGRTCCIIGSYHPSFHKWNEEEYLCPLKARVKKVKEILE